LLASQCPYTNGPAIYKARALYNLIYDNIFEFNDEDCVPEGYSLRPARTSGEAISDQAVLAQMEKDRKDTYFSDKYTIFPNPTAEKIRIRNSGKIETVMISITDAIGSTLFSSKIPFDGSSVTLGVTLQNGIYFLHLINEKNTHVVRKFVVDR
jgi:hypothetical protein